MSRTLSICGLACASLLLTGCDDWGDWGDSGRYKEDFQYTHNLSASGKLSLENVNGSVEISGWDQNKVEIIGSKYAATESTMKAIQIDVVSTPDSIRIRTVVPSGHRGGMGAKYVIHVPRRAEIERVVSSNGRIQIDGVVTASRLKTSNGSVRVTGTRGPLDVETSNASVDLNGHDGPAVIRTSNGTIRAEQIRGYFEATTSNSSITANLTDPEPGRPVKVESSNGSITLGIANLKNNDIRASTSNSSITLKLPAWLNASVKARTSNGSISTDYDVNMRGTISKNSIDGTIGSGGPSIDLSTSNGAIRIQRL